MWEQTSTEQKYDPVWVKVPAIAGLLRSSLESYK